MTKKTISTFEREMRKPKCRSVAFYAMAFSPSEATVNADL